MLDILHNYDDSELTHNYDATINYDSKTRPVWKHNANMSLECNLSTIIYLIIIIYI